MAKFLDLRRQRAGAALIEAGYHEPQDAAEDRQREAVPFDRGVVFGVAVIEEIAVLDEQQAVHDQRRDAGVIAKCIQREPGAVDLVTVAVENPQSGAETPPEGTGLPIAGLATRRIETHKPSQYVVRNGHSLLSQNYPGMVPSGTRCGWSWRDEHPAAENARDLDTDPYPSYETKRRSA